MTNFIFVESSRHIYSFKREFEKRISVTVRNAQGYKIIQRLYSGHCRSQIADFQSVDHSKSKNQQKKDLSKAEAHINKLEKKWN